MKNKQLRIEKFIENVTYNKPMSVQNLCENLNISNVTFKRYLAELRKNGYIIENKKGFVSFKNEGIKPIGMTFTKGSYTSFRILMYIYNNPLCSRSFLIKNFCSLQDENDYSTITSRMLDIHLKKLVSQGLVKKQSKNGEIIYSTTDEIISPQGFDFHKTLCLINYLRIYEDTLPFGEMIKEIIDKLEISCVNHVRKSIDDAENILFTHVVFPDCIIKNDEFSEEEFVNQLEQYCLQGCSVEIRVSHGVKHRVFPFIIIFDWNIGCWYLVCRDVEENKGFDFIRLDRIESYKPCKENMLGTEAADLERKNAWKEINNPFAYGEGEEAIVKVVFLNPSDEELDEIDNRIRKISGSKRELLDDNNHAVYVNIKGTTAFFTWILRFGSKALIIDKELQMLHISMAENIIKMYEQTESAGELYV